MQLVVLEFNFLRACIKLPIVEPWKHIHYKCRLYKPADVEACGVHFCKWLFRGRKLFFSKMNDVGRFFFCDFQGECVVSDYFA